MEKLTIETLREATSLTTAIVDNKPESHALFQVLAELDGLLRVSGTGGVRDEDVIKRLRRVIED